MMGLHVRVRRAFKANESAGLLYQTEFLDVIFCSLFGMHLL